MQAWHLKDNFCTVCGKIYSILHEGDDDCSDSVQFKLLGEVKSTTDRDDLFKFAVKLLLEEWKCRFWSWRQNLDEIEEELDIDGGFEDFVALQDWLQLSLAGLNCSPYPTVELLLRKQGKPAIYADLQDAFACTLLLNKLIECFDVNAEASKPTLSSVERSLISQFPPSIQSLLKQNFSLDLKSKVSIAFSKSPSFRELLYYCSFDSKTEFSSIPLQLLEPCEDSDLGAPFAKRWARRIAARPSAFDKLHFKPETHGPFPTAHSGPAEMNFDVQFPEETEPELLHNNFFELSSLSAEFIEWTAFGMKVAQFLTQIPQNLHQKRLKNTEIFNHFSQKSPVNFRALLLAAGLRGHLNPKTLPPVDIYEILNFNSAETTASLFLGLASSAVVGDCIFERGFLVKLFTMHLSASLIEELEIPPLLQMASSIALGLFCFRSADRGPAQLLLKEMFRPLPRLSNFNVSNCPMLSYSAALGLGFILMGALKGHSADRSFALDILSQLRTQMNVHPQYCVSALMSIALVSFNSGLQEIFSFIPWIRSLGDLLERAEQCIFWNIFAWRMCNWSSALPTGLHDQGGDRVILDFEAVMDIVCQPEIDSVWTHSGELHLLAYVCQVLSANAFYLGLRFAGAPEKVPKGLLSSLDLWMQKILSFPILFNCDPDYFLTRIQSRLLGAFQFMLLARCLIFSGQGDEDCWRYLRRLQGHPLLFKYGQAHLYYSAIGFAFAGSGEARVSTENDLSVAGLLASLLPIFPTTPGEPEFAIQSFLFPFWSFASVQ